MAVFSTATGVASAAADAVGIDFSGIANGVGDFLGFGGKSCGKNEKAKRQEIENKLREFTTRSERVNFVSQYDRKRIGDSPADMAYFFMGEDDCYHKNVGDDHQRFLDDFPGWLNGKIAEAKKQETSYGNGYGTNENKFSGTPTSGKPKQSTGGGVLAGLSLKQLALPAAILLALFIGKDYV